MVTTPLLLADVEVEGARVDVRVEDGRIVGVGPDLSRAGAVVIDGGGGALIPGLHDHHVHLLAMAAARTSTNVSAAVDAAGFDEIVRTATVPSGAWLRVIGYDDRHGPLDRARLDALAPGRPVRVQHRSGAAWVVSTAGLARLDVESDDGWLHRHDDHLAARWKDGPPPDLAPIGARLARYGVTGVTDATPSTDPAAFHVLIEGRRNRMLPQRISVTGGAELASIGPLAGLSRGPVKVTVTDDALPTPDELVAVFRAARRAGRSVAVHCVTRVGLVLALTAWEEVGAVDGDRIEHASVVPVELVPRLVELGLRVVTQPGFVAARGDVYLDQVEPDDVPHLYRCASLIDAGILVSGSTDAPFGPDDPWLAMRTAVDRTAQSGRRVGAEEAITPRAALDLFLSPLDDPGGAPRRVEVGVPADLVLLDAPLDRVLDDLAAEHVVRTWFRGEQ